MKIDMIEMVRRLSFHEGLHLMPYQCGNVLMIGVGRNLCTTPFSKEELKVVGDWKHGITKNMAIYLLRNDIIRIRSECSKNIPFWKNLDSERQYALLDIAFDRGCNYLFCLKNVLDALQNQQYLKAASEYLNVTKIDKISPRAIRIAKLIKTGKFAI